jgi:hypothetical protein
VIYWGSKDPLFMLEFPYESFIGSWIISEDVCDDLIDCFQTTKESNKVPGAFNGSIVNKSVKDSLDLTLHDNTSHPGIIKYRDILMGVCEKYFQKYVYSSPNSRLAIREGYNIQWYPPGGGYKDYHYERSTIDPLNLSRHLAFMTYLNDIDEEGGETEFYYQNIKVKPKKGLTLIWPSDWTHTHRGIPTQQEKIIITGWIHYAN